MPSDWVAKSAIVVPTVVVASRQLVERWMVSRRSNLEADDEVADRRADEIAEPKVIDIALPPVSPSVVARTLMIQKPIVTAGP